MAILRMRRKTLLIAFFIGILIGGIPMTGVVLYSRVQSSRWQKENIELKEKYEDQKAVMVYTLTRNLRKGDLVTDNDLQEVEILTKSTEYLASDYSDLAGKKMCMDLNRNEILTASMVCENMIDDDVRLQELSFVQLNNEILEGSYIDIRIVFPNGQDYIVAGHKRVEKRNEDSIYLYVNEEEILLLSSALVDVSQYSGTKVYGILYVNDYQQSAVKNYPANAYVCQLADWEPDTVREVFTEECVRRRTELESNLAVFLAK